MANTVFEIESIFMQGADFFYNKRDIDAALQCYHTVAAAGCVPAYGEIGAILYYEKNDPEGAKSWFERIQRLESFTPMAAGQYGLLLYSEEDDWENALKYFKWAADLEYEPAYQCVATILYQNQDDIDEAERWFEKAEAANCLFGSWVYYYGILLEFERGIPGKAEYYRAKAIEDLSGSKSEKNLN